MGEEKFEMAVLLTVNRVWLKERASGDASSADVAAIAASVLQFFGISALDFEGMGDSDVAEAVDEALAPADNNESLTLAGNDDSSNSDEGEDSYNSD
mmetsp:Transcript_18944/g.31421  ORF Transcript_18944/g.31421 Transcript_18944/m.31421 type:complete len:97 (-) Transcript_18944:21-311(-)